MRQFFWLIFLIVSITESYGQIPVDTETEFPGGMEAFYDFVTTNIEYPKQIEKDRILGIVFVEFYVDELGQVNIDSVRIVPASKMREVGGKELADQITSNKYLEKEAVRVIKTSPKWIPGKEDGKAVAQKIVFPVSFDKDLFTRPKKPVQKNKTRRA